MKTHKLSRIPNNSLKHELTFPSDTQNRAEQPIMNKENKVNYIPNQSNNRIKKGS